MSWNHRHVAARDIRVGDYLADQRSKVAGRTEGKKGVYVYLALEDGTDVSFVSTQLVTVYRERRLNNHVQRILDDYLDARLAWERDRETVAIGYATEMREYAEAVPPPRFSQFLKQGALEEAS